jgi:hypothetical protein
MIAMLKDLGIGLHETSGSTVTTEASILQWLGTWFTLNCSAHDRAAKLFRHGMPENYLHLHEVMTRLTTLFEHPAVAEGVWSEHTKNAAVRVGSDVKRGEFRKPSDNVIRLTILPCGIAFLGVATGAVLSYLQSTLWSLSSTVTETIRDAQLKHASNRLEPSL